MRKLSPIALRMLLVLMGALFVFIGIDVGFGGLKTLGLQGRSSFFEVTNAHGYLIQDSHSRFFGGLFGGIGFFLVLASTNLHKYQISLKLILALIFIGGLTRFTQWQLEVLFSRGMAGILILELVLVPILFIWLSKTIRNTQ